MKSLIAFIDRTKWRLVWSWNGLADNWKTQPSFRSWIWANIVSIALAFGLPLSGMERTLIIVLGILVVAVEALNTAIEHAIDYISTEQHPLAGRAKDAASAGVFLTAIAAGVVWASALIGLWLS